MEIQNLSDYAADKLAEEVSYNLKGFQDADEAVSYIEDIEGDFDGDSYCPYYSQQVEVIDRYESDYGRDAEGILGDTTYTAADWQKAQTAYAYAIAYTAFSSMLSEAKQELIDAISEFVSDAQSELETEEDIRIQFSTSCSHGWASHDRELADGTMVFESGQLDGCNGMERKVGGVWISCCIDQSPIEEG